MNPDAWKPVATALLGSWPSQVASWGREALAAYLAELQARGMSPDVALVAIRSCPAGQKFPPSASELAALARQDPERPTFDELLAELYGPGGVFGFKRSGVTISPWTRAFAAGRDEWLRSLLLDDPDQGKWARRDLQESWTRFIEATDGREIAEIASRSGRGQLGRLDPLAAIGVGDSASASSSVAVRHRPSLDVSGDLGGTAR